MRTDGGAPEKLRELRDEVKRRIDYRSFYLRYCPEARAVRRAPANALPHPRARAQRQGPPEPLD